MADPANAKWLRHGGTWFAGVNILPNDPGGGIGDTPLAGPAIDALAASGDLPATWDAAQVSVVYPGYPRRDPGETDAAARYRATRDAAHVDGLLPNGPDRRRTLGEAHGFILGLPLTQAAPEASPLVVWEGSHRVIGAELAGALSPHPPDLWPQIDITDAYHAARRACFETCRRVPLHARPGEALLLHRHILHGIAPWAPGATADPVGRMVAYFRPEMAVERWVGG
ncbi:MAG: hypothetical protein HKN02_13830 [Rhodobacteraceae bacterium]|nr:hypothetical protein [Paracoccaceae bacterium]